MLLEADAAAAVHERARPPFAGQMSLCLMQTEQEAERYIWSSRRGKAAETMDRRVLHPERAQHGAHRAQEVCVSVIGRMLRG